MFKKLDIDQKQDDFQELFESHLQELTNEEPMELKTMQRPEEYEEEILSVRKFETKLMANGFGFVEEALPILENQDPNVERFSKIAISVRDPFRCYRIFYDEKKNKTEQTSLNQFFSKHINPQENLKSVANLQENVESMPASPLPSSLNAASYSDKPL